MKETGNILQQRNVVQELGFWEQVNKQWGKEGEK